MGWFDAIGSEIKSKLCSYFTKKESAQGSSTHNCAGDGRTRCASSNRRRNPRFRDGRPVFCIPENGLPFNATVLDASLGGLRIRTQETLERNAVVGVIPSLRGQAEQFLVKVRWIGKARETFVYGLEFNGRDANESARIAQFISPLKLKLQAN